MHIHACLVILIEDDAQDHAFLIEGYKSLQVENKLKFFTKAQAALYYLLTSTDQPFLIISEIFLRGMD